MDTCRRAGKGLYHPYPTWKRQITHAIVRLAYRRYKKKLIVQHCYLLCLDRPCTAHRVTFLDIWREGQMNISANFLLRAHAWCCDPLSRYPVSLFHPLSPPFCAHHHHKTSAVFFFALTVRPLEGILWLVEPSLRHVALPSPDRASGSVLSLVQGFIKHRLWPPSPRRGGTQSVKICPKVTMPIPGPRRGGNQANKKVEGKRGATLHWCRPTWMNPWKPLIFGVSWRKQWRAR